MTPNFYPTTTDDLLLEEIMPAYACPVRAMSNEYSDRIERGEAIRSAAQERARDVWRDEKAIVVALDDYCLTDEDIQALAKLRILASAEQISPSLLQHEILLATERMSERVTEYAQDLIETEEHFL